MQLNIIHLAHRRDRWLRLKKELRNQAISNYKIWDGIVDPYIPARGISKAHKQIVQYALKYNLPEVLIAEDDLKFTDIGAFEFFLKNKPAEYDLYLSSIYYGKLDETNIVEDFSGLTFYIANRRFYEKLLSIPEHDNLDRLLNHKGRFIVCNPFPVIQHNGFSDNTKHYCYYDNYLKDKKLFTQEDF